MSVLFNPNAAQKEAVSHFEGPCAVLAGPGSGKTFTIINRVENLIRERKVSASEILVLTFTRAAATEMKSRFRETMPDDEVVFGTFHSVFYLALRKKRSYKILTEEERLGFIKESYQLILKKRNAINNNDIKETNKFIHGDDIIEISNLISKAKNTRILPRDCHLNILSTTEFYELLKLFERKKRQIGRIDLDDILLLTLNLLLGKDETILRYISRFKFILVDEFQDCNNVQYDILRVISKKDNNLFVVGDDDQSIYGFRGASPGIFRDFENDYPQSKLIKLNINYRSVAEIVNFATHVITANKSRFLKDLRAHNVQIRNKKMTIANNFGLNPIIRNCFKNSKEEAVFIVTEIEKIRKLAQKKGIAQPSIAVLYRSESDSKELTKALKTTALAHVKVNKKNGSDDRNKESESIKDIKAYIRFAKAYTGSEEVYQNNLDLVKDFIRIANNPQREISRDALRFEKLTSPKDLIMALKQANRYNSSTLNAIFKLEWDIKMLCEISPEMRIKYIENNLICEYKSKKKMNFEIEKNLQISKKSAPSFSFDTAEEMSLNTQDIHLSTGSIKTQTKSDKYNNIPIYDYYKILNSDSTNAYYVSEICENNPNISEPVNIMTLHSAKGLEFDIVFIIGANEGNIPHLSAVTKAQVEEERRLFYVGLTRARELLYISFVETKNGRDLLPSRFLK
ncbi:MAG: ATP-dependent helicase [Lachnospiraceae bacterium]|jgi:DNA helicase-2/ATP-dependent DNA helicase PcrA|nr:ATP-dependent helicase [Lachnospiraceae bacterium]